jgi:hypothetical protein
MLTSAELLTSTFRNPTLLAGYDPREVQAFLAVAAATLYAYESGTVSAESYLARLADGTLPLNHVTAESVTTVRFSVSTAPSGFDRAEVDVRLGELAATLRELERVS